ncbi:MAG TPA: DMT family transporter [Xanthobacteraceae bacterium]|jgi:drug/metabolite transporter (DMT)-like permease
MTGNPYLVLSFASLCWSGNHIVGRALAGHLPPLTISTIRWLIPVLIIWAIAGGQVRKDMAAVRQHWGIMLWLGLTGGTLFSALQYVGLQYTTALNVSILNSLVPVLIIVAGALIFRDRIRMVQVVGVSTSLLGVMTIITRGDLAVLRQLELNLGDIITVFSMTVFAIYVAYLRLRPQMHWLTFLFVVGVISTVSTLPLAIREMACGQRVDVTVPTVLAALYVGTFPSLLAFAALNRGVELIGPNRSGPFLHLVPLFTALLATLFLGEKLMAFHLLGLSLILLGVWLAAGRAPAPRRAA